MCNLLGAEQKSVQNTKMPYKTSDLKKVCEISKSEYFLCRYSRFREVYRTPLGSQFSTRLSSASNRENVIWPLHARIPSVREYSSPMSRSFPPFLNYIATWAKFPRIHPPSTLMTSSQHDCHVWRSYEWAYRASIQEFVVFKMNTERENQNHNTEFRIKVLNLAPRECEIHWRSCSTSEFRFSTHSSIFSIGGLPISELGISSFFLSLFNTVRLHSFEFNSQQLNRRNGE